MSGRPNSGRAFGPGLQARSTAKHFSPLLISGQIARQSRRKYEARRTRSAEAPRQSGPRATSEVRTGPPGLGLPACCRALPAGSRWCQSFKAPSRPLGRSERVRKGAYRAGASGDTDRALSVHFTCNKIRVKSELKKGSALVESQRKNQKAFFGNSTYPIFHFCSGPDTKSVVHRKSPIFPCEPSRARHASPPEDAALLAGPLVCRYSSALAPSSRGEDAGARRARKAGRPRFS